MRLVPSYSLANRIDAALLSRSGRRLHFLHVMKCGGTTLRYVLEGYASLNELNCVNEARRSGSDFPDLSVGEVVMGHRRPTDGLTRDDTCYITLLRDPVSRLRSLVTMAMDRTGGPTDEIVSRLTWADANSATALLTGATTAQEGLADRAKELLENRIHLFGFQERLAEFMGLLAAVLDEEGIIFPVFQSGNPTLEIAEKYGSRFAELAATDAELFAFAKRLYAERYAPLVEASLLREPQPGRAYLCLRPNKDGLRVDVSRSRLAGADTDTPRDSKG